MLVLNRLPVVIRGRHDRLGRRRCATAPSCSSCSRELDVSRHATDTLRAQAHEFSNRLHTIAGLVELGEHDEVVRYVHRISRAGRSSATAVTRAVRDPAVAALLIAKASQAAEHGVELAHRRPDRPAGLDDELGTDVVTVVGNLVDNAMDAAAEAPQRWVEVSIGLVDSEVDVVVRDSGPGVAAGHGREVFRRGFTTKATAGGTAARAGIGLALVRLMCTHRGGGVPSRRRTAPPSPPRLPGSPAEVVRVIGVLVVDDDFMVAKVHGGFVTGCAGFATVGVAPPAPQALAEVARLRPGPGAAGHLPARHDRPGGAAPAARGAAAAADVMVISAARDVDSIRTALHGGVVHYLVKPFDRRTFESRLQGLRALRGELDELHGRRAARRRPGVRAGSAAVPRRRCATPKGIAPETLDLVRTALWGRRPGRALGQGVQRAHRPVPGQHPPLPRTAGQRAEAEVRLRYGTAGRPERRFTLRTPRRPG